MHLSIVLPCYNPPEGWDDVIIRNYKHISEKLGPPELIIVNDGSTKTVDETIFSKLSAAIPGIQIISYTENKGKGHALRKGVAAATGDLIIYTDIDFPYDTASLFAVHHALTKEGFDIALAIKNADYYKHVPPARKRISKILRSMIGMFLRMPVTDTQCGLKGFKASCKHIFLATSINRYLFDLEFVRLAFTHTPKLRVKAVPAQLNPNVQFRKMNYRILLPELANFISVVFRKNKS